MNPYSTIDAQLDRRAADEDWVVFREWANAPARFFHLPGDQTWDCFQISTTPPVKDAVVVTARSIDTNDGEEFEQVWRGSASDFDSLLSSAVAQIEIWKDRNS